VVLLAVRHGIRVPEGYNGRDAAPKGVMLSKFS